MIDVYGSTEQRLRFLPALCAMEHFAQLLPDRAGFRLGRREPEDARRAPSRPLCARRHQGVHLRRRRVRHLRGDGAHGGGRAARHFLLRGREGHARALLRRAGEEARLEVAADRHGDVRECRVPVANRLGTEGQGFKIAMGGLDGGRLNIAACSLGGAQFCLDRTIAYMKERKQFGTRLADFQALGFRIADYATALEAARLLLRRAAVAVDRREPGATRLAAQAKRLATDTGFEVVNGCLQLHGGYGYLRDHPIERVLRDLRVHQILEGTNEIMRLDRQPRSVGQLEERPRSGHGFLSERELAEAAPSSVGGRDGACKAIPRQSDLAGLSRCRQGLVDAAASGLDGLPDQHRPFARSADPVLARFRGHGWRDRPRPDRPDVRRGWIFLLAPFLIAVHRLVLSR